MMKNKLLWIITAVSIIATAAVLNFLPNEIPMHFDMTGAADRFGSKYEIFIFPAINIVFLVIYFIAGKYYNKQLSAISDDKKAAEIKNNMKILYIVTVIGMVSFLIMEFSFVFLILSNKDISLTVMPPEFSSLIGIAMGLLITVMGNVMPKARKNALFGLRTPWSMKNDKTWQLSNRFAGILMVIGGVLLIAVSLILNGMAVVWAMMAIILAAAMASIIYSYIISRKY